MDDVEKLRRADLNLSTKYESPRSEAERRLAASWQEVFQIDIVSVLDDFFELGGDSFTATTLASVIEATFDTRFTPADIITLATVAQQAEALTKAKAANQLPACLVLGRAGGTKPPLFMVHGGKGYAFLAPIFLNVVGEDRPVYLFQAPGLDGRLTPFDSIEENPTIEQFASCYIEAMRTVQPTGPYHLAAMCAGAFIAVEMCRQLESAGQAVGRLVLLDPAPSTPRVQSTLAKRKFATKRTPWFRRLVARATKGGANAGGNSHAELSDKKKRLLHQKIDQRLKEMTHVPPDQRSYTAERMFMVSEQLRAALFKHEPRPYPGSATLLVCSARVEESVGANGFWSNHLGSIRYEVLAARHNDVFGTHLASTAQFLKDALD